MIDKRASSPVQLIAPAPLPFVSRRALRRIRHPAPVPTSCDCCRSPRVDLVENSEIYGGRSYGQWPYAYLCRDCGARIGLHPQTDIPLGTMADKSLREARNACKQPFESIWRHGAMSRGKAYRWLSEKMGIAREQCHFGLFNIQQCEQARDICERYFQGRES